MVSIIQRGDDSIALSLTLPHTISSCSGNITVANFSGNYIFTHSHLTEFFSRNHHFYLRFVISIQIVSQLTLQIFSAATLIRSGRAGMVAPEKTMFVKVVIGIDMDRYQPRVSYISQIIFRTYGSTSVYWHVVGTVPHECRLLHVSAQYMEMPMAIC